MSWPDQDITPAILLQHMRGMEGRLTKRMDGMDQRMDRVETHVLRLERNLTSQIDAIDKRLDAMEIEFLPKRVEVLEMAISKK